MGFIFCFTSPLPRLKPWAKLNQRNWAARHRRISAHYFGETPVNRQSTIVNRQLSYVTSTQLLGVSSRRMWVTERGRSSNRFSSFWRTSRRWVARFSAVVLKSTT